MGIFTPSMVLMGLWPTPLLRPLASEVMLILTMMKLSLSAQPQVSLSC